MWELLGQTYRNLEWDWPVLPIAGAHGLLLAAAINVFPEHLFMNAEATTWFGAGLRCGHSS